MLLCKKRRGTSHPGNDIFPTKNCKRLSLLVNVNNNNYIIVTSMILATFNFKRERRFHLRKNISPYYYYSKSRRTTIREKSCVAAIDQRLLITLSKLNRKTEISSLNEYWFSYHPNAREKKRSSCRGATSCLASFRCADALKLISTGAENSRIAQGGEREEANRLSGYATKRRPPKVILRRMPRINDFVWR